MYLQVLLLTGHLCDNLIEQTVHNSGVRTLPKVITNVLSKVCNANQHAPHQGGHFLPANLPPHAPGIWVDHDCNDILSHIQSCKCYVCITAHTRMRISQNQYACVGFHGKATLHSSAKLIKTAKNLVQLVHLVWLTIARQHNTQMHESRHTHTLAIFVLL